MAAPGGPSKRWSLDFLADTFRIRRRFRILAMIDDFTHECRRLCPVRPIAGRRVARELDARSRIYSQPEIIVSDNGSELTSRAILKR